MPLFLSTIAYGAVRLFSLATYDYSEFNQIIAALLVLSFAWLSYKNLKLAWLVLVTELILDGAGHFFELHNLLLRTWFLGIFGLMWLVSKFKNKTILFPNKLTSYSLLGLGTLLFFSAINGWYHAHTPLHIIQDLILFGFLILLFPALEWKADTEKIFPLLIKIWIWGTGLFSLITLIIYSSGWGTLPDTYYHWFRNVASGKITDLGNHFFRIVLPEQVIIVPIILVLAAYLITDLRNKKWWFYLSSSLFILALNFSRIYFVALAIGFFVLLSRHTWKKWLLVSITSASLLLALFIGTQLVVSRGQSTGLALLGVRVNGTTVPTSDVSGAIRLAILPDALQQITTRPWFGSGLGATISYIDPVSQAKITRTQFDWGYLEMLAELGIIGALVYGIFFLSVLKQVVDYSRHTPSPLIHGLLAGALSLVVMTITTPALFHGFGMLYLILLMAITTKNKNTL